MTIMKLLKGYDDVVSVSIYLIYKAAVPYSSEGSKRNMRIS